MNTDHWTQNTEEYSSDHDLLVSLMAAKWGKKRKSIWINTTDSCTRLFNCTIVLLHMLQCGFQRQMLYKSLIWHLCCFQMTFFKCVHWFALHEPFTCTQNKMHLTYITSSPYVAPPRWHNIYWPAIFRTDSAAMSQVKKQF